VDLPEKRSPSLILLDVIMPDVDGFELAQELSEIDDYNHVPIVFITARTEGKDVEQGFEAGGYDYVKKPLDITELRVRIKICN
jgi:DNA-binding response OmpR family regulator